MQIEFQTTKKDYFHFLSFYSLQRLKKRAGLVAIICVFIAMSALGKDQIWWKGMIGLLAFPILWCLLLAIAFLRMLYVLRQSKHTDTSYNDHKVLTTTDDGLQVQYNSSGIIKTLPWSSVQGVDLTKNAIYFSLANKQRFFIPRKYLSTEETTEFLSVVDKYRFSENEKNLRDLIISIENKPPYWMGYLCLIPLIGAFVGIVLIFNGFFKYRKNIKLILMGIGGVALTVVIYGTLIYQSNTADERKEFIPFTKSDLNTLMQKVEFYKIKHGSYPDSLAQLYDKGEIHSKFDPILPRDDNHGFNYKKQGNKYHLFSSGLDGIPNTADDIYPKMAIADTTKFGLILKKRY
ncbi:MAG: type II secretion system protein GspG [Mucilaginibacter sp.]